MDFSTIKPDHPVARLANAMSDQALQFALGMRISKMDVCVALANACGQILADAAKAEHGGKPLPRAEAVQRMDDLRKVMEGAYDLRGVSGEG